MIRRFSNQLPEISRYRESILGSGLGFPAIENPTVSIVVPIHNQAECTIRCLASIQRHSPGIAYEVIVVDDESDLATFYALQAIPGLRVIRNFQNRGFLHSCNRGALNARGDYVLLLNNDTEVTAGWLQAMLDVFQIRADAGLVGARLIYPDGKLQEAGGIVWRDASAWNYGRGQDPSRPEFNYLKEADYCSAAAVMLPRRLWEDLSGFDPRYAPAYFEDTDLAFRVRAAGFKVYFQPKATVIHHEGQSNGTDLASGIKQFQALNFRKFFARWQTVLEREHFPLGERVFQARDRSAGKPCIVFVDHFVPQPDRDAGSRSIFHYLQIFTEAGFNVKFIGDNLGQPKRYTERLELMGIEVLPFANSPEPLEAWIRENGRYVDYAFLSRPYVAIACADLFRAHSQAKLLFYGHDLHFLRTQEEQRLTGASSMGPAERLQEAERAAWSKVDVIYYPAAEECAYVKSIVPEKTVRVLPVYVLPDNAPSNPARFEETSGLILVAGFAHPPNRDALAWFAAEILPLIRQKHPQVPVRICGSNLTEQLKALAGNNVEFHQDVSDAELEALYRASRVAVVPLRYGAGVKGKVVEALFREVPLVMTPAGAQGLPGVESVASVVEDPKAFADEVCRLLEDHTAWEDRAGGSQEFILRAYARRQAVALLRRDIQFSV
jgi:GT2 family glycosyltransferase/glycosyltransferase involved in cell wall biosynthesis